MKKPGRKANNTITVMTHIMRIDEFNMSSVSSMIDKLFGRKDKEKKKEPKKPDDAKEEKKEKTTSEKMIETLKKKGYDIKYDNVMTVIKAYHDDFDEKTISDFKNAKWYVLWGYDGNDFMELIPSPPFETLRHKGDGSYSRTEFYKFTITGENNELEFMCLHNVSYTDDFVDGDYEDNTEDNIYVGVLTK